MAQLDNHAILKQLDSHNYLSHILDIPDQLVQGYNLGGAFSIPASYAQAKQLVFLSTGESRPVALALTTEMADYARLPVTIVDDFLLPEWVSHETVVIALDYYGESEAVLTAFASAAKRKARLLAVSVSGELAREARRLRSPHLALTYGSPARIAFPFALAALANLMKKLDLLELKESTVTEAAVLCRALLQNLHPEVAQYKNNAKQLAEKVVTHQTIVVGSGPLAPMAKQWQISLAATGKKVVVASTLTEFSDTILNGLGLRGKGSEVPLIIMLQSKYDHPRSKLHQTLAYQVAQARKIAYESIFIHPSGSKFGEIALAGLMGEMVGYYVALLHGLDPSFLEATTYIKEQLVSQGPL